MGFFRSEEINRYRMRMPKHHAVSILRELGRQEEIFEIIDVNKNDMENKKNYSLMIKRCEDIQNKINTFYSYCDRFKLEKEELNDYEAFMLKLLDIEQKSNSKTEFFELIELLINKNEKNLHDLYMTYSSLLENLNHLKEKNAVFSKIHNVLLHTDENPAFAKSFIDR